MTTRRATAQNDKALNAFIAAKADIDAMLARISALSSDHFETNPTIAGLVRARSPHSACSPSLKALSVICRSRLA